MQILTKCAVLVVIMFLGACASYRQPKEVKQELVSTFDEALAADKSGQHEQALGLVRQALTLVEGTYSDRPRLIAPGGSMSDRQRISWNNSYYRSVHQTPSMLWFEIDQLVELKRHEEVVSRGGKVIRSGVLRDEPFQHSYVLYNTALSCFQMAIESKKILWKARGERYAKEGLAFMADYDTDWAKAYRSGLMGFVGNSKVPEGAGVTNKKKL